jgi:hypothetical protein
MNISKQTKYQFVFSLFEVVGCLIVVPGIVDAGPATNSLVRQKKALLSPRKQCSDLRVSHQLCQTLPNEVMLDSI